MERIFQRGFTLVELLIVIAVIGILASIILSSLNDARVQGIDVKIQAEMDAIAKRADIENLHFFTYDVVCGSNGITQSSTIAGIITSINTLASSTAVCNSDTGEYAISVPINTMHWCIDSLGIRKEIPNALSQISGSEEYACP